MYVIVEYYAHIGQEPVEEQENLIDYVGKNIFKIEMSKKIFERSLLR